MAYPAVVINLIERNIFWSSQEQNDDRAVPRLPRVWATTLSTQTIELQWKTNV